MTKRTEQLARLCRLFLQCQQYGFDRPRLRIPRSTRKDDYEMVCAVDFEQDDHGMIEVEVRICPSIGSQEEANYYLDRAELFLNETLNYYIERERCAS